MERTMPRSTEIKRMAEVLGDYSEDPSEGFYEEILTVLEWECGEDRVKSFLRGDGFALTHDDVMTALQAVL
jgi:hypothetical protein